VNTLILKTKNHHNVKGFSMDEQLGIFYVRAAAFIGAALAVGIGNLGPSIGQGMVGMKAVEGIGKYPESAGRIRTTMMIAMGLIEASAIYCLMVAGALIYFNL
jgi:F-type H+-transporting ATPase subunit c